MSFYFLNFFNIFGDSSFKFHFSFSLKSVIFQLSFISSLTSAISLFKKYDNTVLITTISHSISSQFMFGSTIDSKMSFATRNSRASTK